MNPIDIIAKLSVLCLDKGHTSGAIRVDNPMVHAYDGDELVASVTVPGGINDRLRSEIRMEALHRGLDIR